MRDGDYTAALSCFQKAADRGYSKAQYNVGLCHEHGRGTPRDLGKVLHLLPAPRPVACAAPPRVASRNEPWAGLGKVQLLSSSPEGKLRKKSPASRNLDSKHRKARDLVFLLCSCILTT